MSRSHLSRWLVASLALLLIALPQAVRSAETAPAADAGPEAVVKGYLTALKGGDFSAAFELLTPNMRAGDAKDAWVQKQNLLMKLAEVQITSFEVFPAKVEGKRAIVPNLLHSKDKFINQTGEVEHELYTVVQSDDGKWLIDQQELVEPESVEKWFPGRAKK
jgi:hypothetical protein